MSTDPGQNNVGRTVRETTLKNKEGKEIPISTNIEFIKDDEETILGGVLVFRDISEEKALEQMKKDFVSAITHDLKNPLVPIIGFSSRILQGKLGVIDRQVRDAVQIIHGCGEKIFNLIENYLSASKVEGGELELELGLVSMKELMNRFSPLIDLQKKEKELEFEIFIPDDLPFIHADRIQIERVLGNLIWNAIKFTPTGGSIMVRAKREGYFVRVDVEDTGVGISEDSMPFIFEKYKKAKGTAAQGAGLGLYIAKSIIEAHGGTISVKSSPNKGSCFSFTLPIKHVTYS
jgi:signal transduction histidine kinase